MALCSTLDEHATSNHKVGFQLFSFIVEDWRCYNETLSTLMKYCAISSLLSEASSEGQIFVERNLPQDMDKDFPKFLNKTLNIDVGKVGKKKVSSLLDVVKIIKATRVRSLSRNRLIVVSRRDVSSTPLAKPSDLGDEVSDVESTTSTVINCPASSSSGTENKVLRQNQAGQPTGTGDTFLKDIGLDFCLDNVGDLNESQSAGTGFEFNYDRDSFLNDSLAQEESLVSSSSAVPYKIQQKKEKTNLPGRLSKTLKSVSFDEEEMDITKQHKDTSKNASYLGYEPLSDHEEQFKSLEDEEEEDMHPPPKKISSVKGNNGNVLDKLDQELSKKKEDSLNEDEDSDLELIEIPSEADADACKRKVIDNDNDTSDSSCNERDEAEPESGEDYVPNYDEDSNEEEEEDMDVGVSTENNTDQNNAADILPETDLEKESNFEIENDDASPSEGKDGNITEQEARKEDHEHEDTERVANKSSDTLVAKTSRQGKLRNEKDKAEDGDGGWIRLGRKTPAKLTTSSSKRMKLVGGEDEEIKNNDAQEIELSAISMTKNDNEINGDSSTSSPPKAQQVVLTTSDLDISTPVRRSARRVGTKTQDLPHQNNNGASSTPTLTRVRKSVPKTMDSTPGMSKTPSNTTASDSKRNSNKNTKVSSGNKVEVETPGVRRSTRVSTRK